MARKREHRSGKYFRLVIAVLIVLSASSIFAEDFSGRIILEKTNFVVGEDFSFRILVPGAAPLMLSVETPHIPNGIRLLKGPYMRPGKSGTVVDYYFRVEKPGRYVLGSFTLKTALKTGYTTPVFIKAGKNDYQLSGIDDVPPVVKWAVPLNTYYPGEIIPLRFVVENLESEEVTLESSIYSNNSGIVNRISRNGDKEEKVVATKNMLTGNIYDIFYHNHIFIPVFPGTIQLPGAEVFISKNEKSYNTFLPEQKIVITSVPSKIKNTGAIGNFTSDLTFSDNLLHPDEIIVIKRVIKGTGNFYAMNIPTPYSDMPELVEINTLKENLYAEPDGQWFTGSLTMRYSLKVKKTLKRDLDDSVTITVPDMAVMRINNKAGGSPRYEFYELEGGSESISLTSLKRELSYSELYSEKDSNVDIFLISVITSAFLLAVAAVVISARKKGKIFTISLIVIITVIIVLILFFVFKENEVYGIISPNPQMPGIYNVPDENSSIKYSASSIIREIRVPVKGSYEDFYLIEMSDGGEGWIKKDNIRLENE